MMTIINVFAARVCSGGCCADGRVDGQTDRCVGKPCPPSILCSPGASLCWFALASSILSQLSGLGMGSEPRACGLHSLPQPWWSRDELGGRTGTPGSGDFISVAAGARSAHAQRCPRVKDRGQRRNLCIPVLPRVSPCLNARQGSATSSRRDRGPPNHCCGPGPCLVWKVSTSLLLTQLLSLSKPSLWLGCFCCSHGPLQREPLPPPNTHFTWAADSPRLRQNQPELIEHLLCSSKATSIPPAEPNPWTSSCSHPFCSLSPSVTFSPPQGFPLLSCPCQTRGRGCCQHPHPGPWRSPYSLGPHGI